MKLIILTSLFLVLKTISKRHIHLSHQVLLNLTCQFIFIYKNKRNDEKNNKKKQIEITSSHQSIISYFYCTTD